MYFRFEFAKGYELWKSDGTATGTVLVKDILSGASSSSPKYLTNVNGTLYFRANDGVKGDELWKSDGTQAGTVLIKDIRSGTSGSSPKNLISANATLYFTANDGTNGYELWKSDGTANGTVLVKDIRAGSVNSQPKYLTNSNGTLYFSANDGTNGYELWKSDGTAAGTVLVRDIRSGVNASNIKYLTDYNGTLFFRANNGVNGYELWKSDGTSSGTVLVKDLSPLSGSNPSSFTAVGGTLYFRAVDDNKGLEIWKTDGTAAGTLLVTDIRVGAAGSGVGSLTNLNGTLTFVANDGTRGYELWKSNGTGAGTVLVKDIADAASSYPKNLTNVDGTLYFRANDGTTGYELWKSNGTEAGTVLVKDIRTGSTSFGPYSSSPDLLTNVNGTLFFVANNGTNGQELWKSDGTSAGTVLVKDISLGNASTVFNSLTNVNGTLYFSANDGVQGYELWKSDGTASGTVLIKDILPGSNSSNPKYLTNVNGTLYFRANDSVSGEELSKSDGTSAGTTLVKDILPGGGSSGPTFLTNVNGTLYFRADNGVNGLELLKSDGTTAGTVIVKDIIAGGSSSSPAYLTNVNGTLYFSATDGVNGTELWKSDGTVAGTGLVKDVVSGITGSSPSKLTAVGGTLFFRVQVLTGGTGYQLWKSDGTDAGTIILQDIIAGNTTFNFQNPTSINGRLFSRANDGVNGEEVWISDGTPSGTKLFADVFAGSGGGFPREIVQTGKQIFFNSYGAGTGLELWSINGPSTLAISAASIAENNAPNSLVGSLTTIDPNPGETFSYSLVPGTGSGDNSFFTISGDQVYANSAFDYETKNSYTIRVRTTDSLGLWLEQTFAITVLNGNEAPTSLTLSSNALNENAAANTVFGTFSTTDPDIGDNFTYSLVSGAVGTDNAAFSINGNQLSANASLDYETKNVYGIQVRTSDAGGLTFDQTFTINVSNVNDAPTNLSLSTSSIAENNPVNAVVGVFSSTDQDPEDSFTYSLVAGTGATENGAFTISGNQLMANVSFDYETQRSCSIRVRTTDAGGLTFEKIFTITVTDVNESPTGLNLSSTTIAENNLADAVIGTFSSIDPDAGDTFIYSLVTGTGSTDNAAFTISGNQLKANAAFDFDTKSSYSIRVRTTDVSELAYEQVVTINVTNVNEAPTSLSLSSLTIAENNLANAVIGTFSSTDPDAGDTFTYSLVTGTGSTDNAAFTINGGELKANAPFDFETKNNYSIRVRTTDAGELSFEQIFTITVTNVNENPTVLNLSSATIAENNPANAVIGTFSSTDPDAGVTFSYSLVTGTGSTDNAAFSISGSQLKANASFDFETLNSYSIRVRTTDADGLTFEQIFTITVTNVNESPTALNLSSTTITENNFANAVIGTFTSTDPDAGDTFTYSLISGTGSTDNAAFTISGSQLKGNAPFDFESQNSYSIRVRTTDAGGLTFEQIFTITVTNQNEAPMSLNLSSASIAENNLANAVIGTFISVDPDAGDTFTYSLITGTGSTDNAAFTISGNQLKANAPFDFETQNSYSIRVRTMDDGGLYFERTFTINVTDVVEDVTAPTSLIAALPAASTSLAIPITASGSDPGAGASGVKEYDLYYSTGGAFTKFATVPANSPTTTFTGSANTTYWFRSLGRDNAGNVESKITSDTFTRIGDVTPPATQVTTAVPKSTGLFAVSVTGTKASGSALAQFNVYVSVDGAAAVLVGSANANAVGGGVYSASVSYQGLADGTSHTYAFYSRGRDGAGNVEAAPATADITINYSFASVPFSATGIDVQNGAAERSYVRYLDVLFSNAAGLNALLAAGRVVVERFAIDAASVTPGTGTLVPISSIVQNGNKLQLDFGASGIGGVNAAGNGFYRVRIDVDGNGSFTDTADGAFEFHRLFGDATGNGIVDVADTNLITSQIGRTGLYLDGDLDGNGVVNSTDRLFSTQQRGKKLLDSMLGWLDD